MPRHLYRPPVAYQRPQIFRRRTWEYYSLSWLYDRATQVYSIADVSGGLGPSSLFEGASPPVETGFIVIYDLVSNPGHYAVTVEPDGDPIIASGGDTSRQSFSGNVFGNGVFYGAWTAWINNSAPEINPDADPDDFLILSAINVAMAPRDVARLFVDTDDLVLSYSVTTGALVAGTDLSVDGSITGTPVAYGWPNVVTVRAVDIAGAPAFISLTQYVGDLVPEVVERTEAEALAALTGFEIAYGEAVYDPIIPEGSVVSIFPFVDTLVEHGTLVTLVLSLGPVPSVIEHVYFGIAQARTYLRVSL